MTSWRGPLAALAAVRVAVPLAVLAASGSKLPGLPRYEYGPLTGDGPAYYSSARGLLSGWRGPAAAGLLLVPLGLLAALRLRRTRPVWAVLALALSLSLAAAFSISASGPSSAGAVGWPLLWSVPLAPLRALGVAGQDGAFAVGLALSLACNAVTVVATGYAGLLATGRRSVGLGAAALFALWPLLAGAIAGTRGWENGTWEVDAGLHMYTEPLSTALVAVGAALLLGRLTPLRLAGAGLALGYAFAVRPTNGLFAALAVLLVLWRERRAALPLLAGALVVAPIVIAFAPQRRGYDLEPASDRSGALFGSQYVGSSWTDSLLWSPRTLLVLVPVALVGALLVRSRAALLLVAGWALLNPVFYSFVRATAEHPRYLFASLPAVLVLWAAGACLAVRAVGKVRSS